ncbi:MAG: radical SAM protein [Firmicutes bacterium]|nr:radical SAM protein [Bacillota bacterium]
MLIERVLYPVTSLGPGERLVIWTSGCSKGCANCISPEMWQPRTDKNIPNAQLLGFVRDVFAKNTVDGITISGGDPLEQADELLEFLVELNKIGEKVSDILIYTGYTLSELQQILTAEQLEILQKNVAVLIDGKYVDELNDSQSPLIGSTNQQIHYFNAVVRPKYEIYRQNGRQIQNFYYGDNLLSVGIHSKKEE